MVRFEYTADEVLVIVTQDCHIYMIKPKEEDNIITKDISASLENSVIEGAKIHENSLILLSFSKKVYIIKDLNEFTLEPLCDVEYGKVIIA